MSKRKYLWYAAIIILGIAAMIFYKYNKYPFINNKISDAVKGNTDSLYKISYDSISVNELAGDLFIHNLHIKGDTALQKKFVLSNDTAAANVLMDIFIPVLKVSGFKTARALLSKQLACNQVIISNPRVTIYVFPGQKKDDIKKQGEKIYKQLLGKYNLIQADSVSVMNSEVVAINFFSKEVKFRTYNTSINLNDLRIDSTHNYDTSRTLFCKEIFVHTDKVALGDIHNASQVTNLTFNTRDKILVIGNILYEGIKSGSPFSGSASGISVTGIEAAGAIDSMNIVVGKTVFKNAFIQLKGKEKVVKEIESKHLLTGWVKSIKVKDLQAANLSLKMLAANPKNDDIIINNSVLKVRDFNADTASRLDFSLLKNVAEVNVTNNLLSFKSADNLYVYKLGGVNVNTSSKTLSIRDFSVNPTLNEKAFAKKAGVQKDRYNISIKNLVCSSVNFNSLVRGVIDIGLIKTSGDFLKIYRDISYPLDSISKVGKHPHQMISKIGLPLNIKKIIATNTLVEYKERNGLSDTSGTVRFEKSLVTISNITNSPQPANKKMDMAFETLFLGQVPLKANITFNLYNLSQGLYQVTGSVKKPFNGTLLNHVILPMGLVQIDKGNINSVDFNFTGDNLEARGLFVMKYNDLKLSLYKKDKQKVQLNKKGITSLLANVIVKNANPSNNKLRQANIVYRRDDYKSFFNMIWKFMFTGIKDIIGARF